MPNRSADILFQLIKSLEKAEKRHFKLYIKRSSGKEDLKIIRLFDALVKQKEYDEKKLLKKMPDISKPQLANLKTQPSRNPTFRPLNYNSNRAHWMRSRQ